MVPAGGGGREGLTRHFQYRDSQLFDYKLGSLDDLPGVDLRGPVPDIAHPYFVCVGGTQVFGRFCNQPFPELLSEALELPVLNLGLSGHGPQAFLEDRLLSLINRAQFAVVQLASGRIGSNSEFRNSQSGRGEGERLRDGKLMSFEDFLAEELSTTSHEHVRRLVEETRDSWVGHYRDLLTAITTPTVVHWFSTVTPYRRDDYSDIWRLLGRFPQLVDGKMLSAIRPFCNAYVETVCRQGLPQPLWAAGCAIGGTELRNGRLFNTYYPSPEMHLAAARDLRAICKVIIDKQKAAASERERTVVIAQTKLDTQVVSLICQGDVECLTYSQILSDRGLLPMLAVRKPRFLHVRRRNREGFLSQQQGVDGSPVKADAVAAEFTANVQSVIDAEEHVATSCRGCEPLEVFLEDLVAKPESIAASIADFTQRPVASDASIQQALSFIPQSTAQDNLDLLRPVFMRISQQFMGNHQ